MCVYIESCLIYYNNIEIIYRKFIYYFVKAQLSAIMRMFLILHCTFIKFIDGKLSG